jgi:hypothetical protein
MESTLVVTIAEIRPALIPFWTMKPTYVAAGYKGRKWDFLAVPEFAPYVGFLLGDDIPQTVYLQVAAIVKGAPCPRIRPPAATALLL